MPDDIKQTLLPFLKKVGLAENDSRIELAALSGGVSSDIYRLDMDGRAYCLKQALPKLKVDADWYADTDRSYYESEWLRFAYSVNGKCVPEVIAYDAEAGYILMEYLPPDQYPVWKKQLMDGIIDVEFASQVGQQTGLLHAKASNSPEARELFRTGSMFHQLRIEPYLLYTGRKYKDTETHKELLELANALDNTHITLIHGDVSPKNILAGPEGPVFVDAECAYYGDPAFDLAFCLNHLLLKSVWKTAFQNDYLEACNHLVDSYLEHVSWENVDTFVARCARLLPALMLARIDGKSPVEYLTSERQKEFIRGFSIAGLCHPSANLYDFVDELKQETKKQLY